jgi:hypothetical protein
VASPGFHPRATRFPGDIVPDLRLSIQVRGELPTKHNVAEAGDEAVQANPPLSSRLLNQCFAEVAKMEDRHFQHTLQRFTLPRLPSEVLVVLLTI